MVILHDGRHWAQVADAARVATPAFCSMAARSFGNLAGENVPFSWRPFQLALPIRLWLHTCSHDFANSWHGI